MEQTDKKVNVLMVDDDTKLCRLVKDYLEPLGYIVESAHDGYKGLEMVREGDYQVMILDVMMPGMDGFETLRELRKTSDIPVLMLTALGEEPDRIVGLEMGADDYLPKTFSTRELLARLRAVTRRYRPVSKPNGPDLGEPFTIGDLSLHEESRSVYKGKKPVILTPIEYELLRCLVRSAGRVLTRDQILDKVFDRDYDVFDRAIDVHISSLRKKIGDNPRNPIYIKTVRSAGYMMEPQPAAP